MTETMTDDRAITTAVAAGICGVAEITLKRAVEAGLLGQPGGLPSFKVGKGEGRARRIWLSDLRAWTTGRMEAERARKIADSQATSH